MTRFIPSPVTHVAARRVLAAAVFLAASSTAMAGSPHLIYLPSTEAGVDHAAIVQAFEDQGFEVSTFAYAGESRLAYAHRIADEVRAMMDKGVAPEEINVVGAGTGSKIATLTSALVGNRHVNYALLGACDPAMKANYNFRMSGRVLGIHDANDSTSLSCRSLWGDSPKVSERQELVLNSGHGSALFHEPRKEWLQPVSEWATGGEVSIGETSIGRVDEPAPSPRK